MRVIAILAAYNEERFIAPCLDHFAAQGVETYLLDNESTDRTVEIAERYLGRGLIGIESFPREGVFDLTAQLGRKEELALELGADWFIHADPDEVRLPPRSDKTLAEALAGVDGLGYDAVNFVEYAFVPTKEEPNHDHPEYQRTMRHYYPFLPRFPHRLNAWKRQPERVDLSSSGGHRVEFPGLRAYPEPFKMRHYPFLSAEHFVEKYAGKDYDAAELRTGKHGWRARVDARKIQLPSQSELSVYASDDALDLSNPRTQHVGEDWTAPRKGLPVIVGGCHRSGTSLVRRMLDAHSRIHCGPEVKFFRDFFGDYAEDPLRHIRFATTARHMLPEQDLLEEFGGAFVRSQERAASRAGKPRWADKNPENVLYLRQWTHLLGRRWVFVHVVRNPLDTLASIKEARFPLTIPPDLESRIELYKRYTRVGAKFGDRHPAYYYRIVYERLVEDPEGVLADLMDWLEEDFEPAQLAFNSAERERGLEDPKIRQTTAAHTDSVGRWRKVLTQEEAVQIARECAPLWHRVSGERLADPSGNGSRPPKTMLPRRIASRLRSKLYSWKDRSRIGEPGEEGRAPTPFIVGAGRSGTTLLRLMLDAHPDLAIPPETHFIPEVSRACGKALDNSGDPRRVFLETVTAHRRWEDFKLEKRLLAERIAAIEPFDLGQALRAFYGLYAQRFGKPRWGDKTPPYVRNMGLVGGLLPEARFLHVIRDGRDVALSSMGLWFGPGSVEEAARRWQSAIRESRRQAEDLPHYLEVHYEDLVTDTEATLKGVCDFVDLPWNPIMLEYHETAQKRMDEMRRDVTLPDGETVVSGEQRTGIHALTNRPPQSDRIGRWKTGMAEGDRETFEGIAGETLKDLGYESGFRKQ
ncbi:sulfotransferase [Rubrobacter tropicus]|uniref:sulfotransferase n=1 Tax=Rubrobacter tropicus TaxID=2653851 RepID=UPI001D181E02|nr:sulfotransferase [Rubrobacter tropicus]